MTTEKEKKYTINNQSPHRRYQGINYKILAIESSQIQEEEKDNKTISIRFKDKTIRIKKERLKEISRFFRDMLTILEDNDEETNESLMVESDDELRAIDHVSKGKGMSLLSVENIIDYIQIAYKYDMQGWIKECTNYIEHRLDDVLEAIYSGEKTENHIPRFKNDYWARIPESMRQLILNKEIRQLMEGSFTGVNEWQELFGVDAIDETEVPILPDTIKTILESPCPMHIGTEKKIYETHILYLMPKTLKGKDLTMIAWDRMLTAKEVTSAHLEGCKFYDTRGYKNERFANRSIGKTRWVLMPKAMLPGSANKSFAEHEAYLRNYQEKYPEAKDYDVISAIGLTTGIFLNYLRTGERLYGEDYKVEVNGRRYWPYGRTRDASGSARPVYIGSFDSTGLSLLYGILFFGYGMGLGVCRSVAFPALSS